MGRVSTTLSERDIKIFELIKKFGWIREDFIAKYLKLDWSSTKVKHNMYALGTRLYKNEFVTKVKIIEGYPAYWSLAKNGAIFMNCKQQNPMSLATLRHNDMVAELAVHMLVNNSTIILQTEHEIKQNMFGISSKNIKLPDIIINKNIAIEVELSRKNDNKLTAIVNHYLSSNYEKIIYYTNNIGIANKIKYLAKNNEKFNFKLFNGLNILENENYNISDNLSVIQKNNLGQFINAADEKLRNLGAFD